MELRERWARRAHELKWNLTPLNGKKPKLDGWTERPHPELDQLLDWCARGNLGVITGPPSGIFVIDFDFATLAAEIDLAAAVLEQEGLTPEEKERAEAAAVAAGAALRAARKLHASLPPTPTMVTGTGGLHSYFSEPEDCPGNSVKKLGPGIDTRGKGGMVVFAGGVHPETEQVYDWKPGFSPDDLPLAELPAEILAKLRPKKPTQAPQPQAPVDRALTGEMTPYGKAALDRIYNAISTAPAGTRNETLNREGFGAWQLFAGGEILSAFIIENALFQAATSCGLVAEEGEAAAWATIRSARAGGEANPKSAPPLPARRGLRAVPPPEEPVPATGGADAQTEGAASESNEAEGPADAASSAAPHPVEILIPGLHRDHNEDIEVGNHSFVDSVIRSLPEGTLYRRGDVPGEIVGPPGEQSFRAVTNERVRVLMDAHLRLAKWVRRKSDATPWLRFENATNDHARLVIDTASTHEVVRPLKHLVSYPVFLEDWTLAQPGWNEAGGVYYDCPPELDGVGHDLPDLARTRAMLDDLVIDFPWKPDAPNGTSSSSRENFFGLLLTPMVRPALGGNIPLHMILSTIPRSGKSKLAEQVLGGTYLGKPAPARQLGSTEEEREKRIVSMLLQGDTIVHLDNIRDFLDSAHIASLLTSTEFSARRLGVNDTRPMPNNLILVASGNNIRATEEIVKRSVPVWLTPDREDPENRTDFNHPDLPAYISEQRTEILSVLVSMVVRWRDGERVLGPWPKGGFERWAEVIGGVLLANGLGNWRANEKAWQRAADTQGEDLRALVACWWERHQSSRISTGDVLDMVEELGVFPHTQKSRERSGKLVSLSRSVLGKQVDAPVLEWFLRRSGSGSSSLYFLEAMK